MVGLLETDSTVIKDLFDIVMAAIASTARIFFHQMVRVD